MTVFNTGYSSLEEAWGEPYLSPSLQQPKKKKKKQLPINDSPSDPICDLYAMGNNHYQDSDIISFANQFYDKHDKVMYQKPLMLDREKHPKTMEIRDGSVYAYGAPLSSVVPESSEKERDEVIEIPQSTEPDVVDPVEQAYTSDAMYEEDDEAAAPAPRNRYDNTKTIETMKASHDYYLSERDPDYYRKDTAFQWMDVMLYILSGIILIFMMEQFVKVGMHLQ